MLVLIWVIYFFTDIYGHVALKFATKTPTLTGMIFSHWALTAGAAWIISALTWALLLSRQSFLTASTVSALTYVFIALTANLIFGEALTWVKWAGIAFVCIGIYLVTI